MKSKHHCLLLYIICVLSEKKIPLYVVVFTNRYFAQPPPRLHPQWGRGYPLPYVIPLDLPLPLCGTVFANCYLSVQQNVMYTSHSRLSTFPEPAVLLRTNSWTCTPLISLTGRFVPGASTCKYLRVIIELR